MSRSNSRSDFDRGHDFVAGTTSVGSWGHDRAINADQRAEELDCMHGADSVQLARRSFGRAHYVALSAVTALLALGCGSGTPNEAGVWSLVELTGGDAEALALNQYEAELQIGQGRSGGFDLSLHSGISRPRPGLSGCTLVIGRAERGDERLRLTERYEVPDEGCTVIDVPAAVVLVEELLAGVGWTQPRDDRLVVTTDDGLTYTFERAEDVSE